MSRSRVPGSRHPLKRRSAPAGKTLSTGKAARFYWFELGGWPGLEGADEWAREARKYRAT